MFPINDDYLRRLELAMQGSRLGFWDWDMVGGKTAFNERWAEIIGYQLDELEPTTIETWIEHTFPEDLEKSNKAIAAHIAGETDYYDVEVRMKHRDGHAVWVHDRGRIVDRGPDGEPLRMVGTHEDITERIEREIALEEARTVFENSKEGIVVLDADEVVTSVNPAFTKITGWKPAQVVGRPFDELRTHADDPEESQRLRAQSRTEAGVRVQREMVKSDGTRVPMLMSINRALGPDDKISGLIVQLSDLSDYVRAEADRLNRVLFTDETTGLMNLRGLNHYVESESDGSTVSHAFSALMVVSLDNLASVREAFGNEGAELVVAVAADRLRGQVSSTDRLARTTRNEFVILLRNCVDREHARQKAKEFLEALAPVCQVPGVGSVSVTASIGVTLHPAFNDSLDHMIREASAALSDARDDGSGTVSFYKEGSLKEVRDRVIRVTQIREAWDRREFYLEYQPMCEMGDGRVVGVEALMRWQSPDLGPVSPAEFIPVAEQIGLIVDMGTWVVFEATRQAAEFADDGLDIGVSINVTVQQLTGGDFPRVVAMALEESGISADKLTLELTESTLLHFTGGNLEILARLEALGVRIAIDDFGTGYSSFAYLHQYPLHRFKIDRSFVKDLTQRQSARSIVTAIIELGHHLGLEVVAEGVETDDQLRILRDMGCDLYQGFLKSPAVDPATVIEMMQRA